MKRSVKKDNLNKNILIDVLGWFGVTAILLAYILLNFNIFTSSSLFYQFLNLFGSFAILFEAYKKKDYQPAMLNLIWAIVAIIVILRILLLK